MVRTSAVHAGGTEKKRTDGTASSSKNEVTKTGVAATGQRSGPDDRAAAATSTDHTTHAGGGRRVAKCRHARRFVCLLQVRELGSNKTGEREVDSTHR